MLTRAFVLFLVGVVGLGAACATLQQAEAPAVRLFECTTKAFEPIAGTYERAQEIVKAVQAHSTTVSDVLDAAQATAAESVTLANALKACSDEAEAALAPDAGTAE